MRPSATILITTKDRRIELERALASTLNQSEKAEILVFDDGSSDGTSDMVQRCFPSVLCYRSDRPLGIIGARNQAMALASGSVVITVDDDCIFQSAYTVAQTLDDFNDPSVAAVAIPHIDVNSAPVVHSKAPHDNVLFLISEFTGCASAVRRDIFLGLGGFRSALWRQTEESDFCTRLLDAGYLTRCGTADPILHYESSFRDRQCIVFHAARGNILYAWHNVPSRYLVPHVIVTALLSLRQGIRSGSPKPVLRGILSAGQHILREGRGRTPVGIDVYRLFRRLRRNGPIPLAIVESRLRSFRGTAAHSAALNG